MIGLAKTAALSLSVPQALRSNNGVCRLGGLRQAQPYGVDG
jgi:hypothetical protein